ncbi:MAG: hypothetical protein IK070_01700 [Clostridia bacterium]|nr:hypothetical protein [Clostridia bacterium]
MSYFDRYSLDLLEQVNNNHKHICVRKNHTMSVDKWQLGDYDYDDLNVFDNVALIDLEKYEQWLSHKK